MSELNSSGDYGDDMCTVPLGCFRRVFVGVLGPEFSEQGIVCPALGLVGKSQRDGRRHTPLIVGSHDGGRGTSGWYGATQQGKLRLRKLGIVVGWW